MPNARKITRLKPDLTKEMIDRCLLGIASTEMELLKANNSCKLPHDGELTKYTPIVNDC